MDQMFPTISRRQFLKTGAGLGGARDAVLYSVTVNSKRAYPIASFIPGQTDDLTLVANTVLRNQPYGQQDSPPVPPKGNCA